MTGEGGHCEPRFLVCEAIPFPLSYFKVSYTHCAGEKGVRFLPKVPFLFRVPCATPLKNRMG